VGTEQVPLPGRLVMGVLWSRDADIPRTRERLAQLFGPVCRQSETVLFRKFTDHYEKEMGQGISRCFWAFLPPLQRGALADAKLATNRIERIMEKEGNRTINLDPGLLTPEALILASTKPHYHRIYLSRGIYAELTLVYQRKCFDAMPWTYPDYREEWAREFFSAVRDDLLKERDGT
jgi:hypothetical protein